MDAISLSQLTKAFNTSFGDYQVPFLLNEQQLASKLLRDNIKNFISPIAMHSRNTVGFMLHGLRKTEDKIRVYNGGTGIIPQYRHRGYLHMMLESALPTMQKLKASTIQLEVLENNKSAIRSYEHLGFQIERKVLCYKGVISIKVIQAMPHLKVAYKQPNINNVVRTNYFDFKPTWQNEIRSALNNHSKWICIYNETGELVAFTAYSDLKIDTFGVAKQDRYKAIGSFLFSLLAKRLRGKEIKVLNVDVADIRTQLFLKNIGLKQFINQYEMVKTL